MSFLLGLLVGAAVWNFAGDWIKAAIIRQFRP